MHGLSLSLHFLSTQGQVVLMSALLPSLDCEHPQARHHVLPLSIPVLHSEPGSEPLTGGCLLKGEEARLAGPAEL